MSSKAIAIIKPDSSYSLYGTTNGGKYALDSRLHINDTARHSFDDDDEHYVLTSYDTENDPDIGYETSSGLVTLKENEYTESGTFKTKNVSDTGTIALMRTNPKLTGNIRLVVDSNEDMYLDTFKVNTALANKKYHKVPVSYKSFYGKDVFSVFNEMASEDLYCIPEDYRRIFKTAKDFSEQYIDTYRCGVKTNTDDLYSESFSAFAPIVIDGQVPDFFIVFKLENATPLTMDKDKIPSYLIQNGKQVKCFDLREGSKIGTYLRTFRDYGREIISPVYLSRHINTQTVFYGISVDNGSVSNAKETINLSSYLRKNQRNYDDETGDVYTYSNISYQDMNYNLVHGFEKNRLISHNTLNLEFMFDDPDAGQFEQNTYYGIYVCTNELDSNVYFMTDDDGNIRMYNSDNVDVTDSSIQISDLARESAIYGFEIGDTFYRSMTQDEDDAIIANDLNDKTGENVFTAQISAITNSGSYNKFISATFNGIDSVRPGEHYRIIDETNSTIYEVVIGNAGLYKNGLSDESVCVYHREYTTETIDYTVYSICVDYSIVKKTTDESTLSSLVAYIYKAFNSFSCAPFKATRHYGNTIVIQSGSSTDLYFERISGITVMCSNDTDLAEEALAEQKEDDAELLTVFGNTTLTPVIVNPKDENSIVNTLIEGAGQTFTKSINNMLTPFGFELAGSRIIYAAKLYSYSGNLYEAEATLTDELLFENFCYEYYSSTTKTDEVVNYQKFNIEILEGDNTTISFVGTGYNTIMSIYDPSKYMFVLPSDYSSDKIFLNKHYTCNRSICSIFHLVDYDYDINAGDLDLTFNDLDTLLIAGDKELKKIYTFGNRPDVSRVASNARYKSLLNLLYGRLRVCDYALAENRFDTNQYASDTRHLNVDYSMSSIVSPTVCKWVTTGTDSRGEQMNIPEVRNMLYHDGDTALYETLLNYNISDEWSGTTAECDLSSISNGKTLRDSIIAGEFDFDKVIDVTPIGKLFKLHNNSFGIISNGYCSEITYDNIINGNVLDSINDTYLVLASTPAIDGVSSQAELFVDEVNKISYLISYGGVLSDYQKETLGDYIQLRSISSSELEIDRDSNNLRRLKIDLHQDVEYIDASIAPATTEVILHSDYVTIKATATCDIDDNYMYVAIDPKLSVVCSITYFSRTPSLITNEQVIKELEDIIQSNYALNVYVDGSVFKKRNIGIDELGNEIDKLPVFIKKGTDNTYYQYVDDYSISCSNLYADNEDPGTCPKTLDWLLTNSQSKYVMDTFVQPKKVQVFSTSTTTIGDVEIEQFDGIAWDGNIPYYLYVEDDYRPTKVDIVQTPSIALPQDGCEIYTAIQLLQSNPKEIMSNSFDQKLYKKTSKILETIKFKSPARPGQAVIYKILEDLLLSQPNTTDVPGYSTGFSLKTYMNSVAIQKKANGEPYFNVSKWDTPFTRTNKNGQVYIYYNLSVGVEKEILNSSYFNKIWQAIGVTSSTYKKLFIKNTIMPMLKINASSEITVKFTPGSADKYEQTYSNTSTSADVYRGATIEYEKGQYLIKVLKNDTKSGTYQVKCKIKI